MKLKLALIIGLLCVMQIGLVRSGWFEKEIPTIVGVTCLSILGIRQVFKNKCEQMLEEYKAHLYQYHNYEFDANKSNCNGPRASAFSTPISCAVEGGFYCQQIGIALKNSICWNVDVKMNVSLILSPSRISYSFEPINPQFCYRNITLFKGTCDL